MKKNIDILDLTKFILSLMIVAIHTNLFPLALYPWLRLAVPLFFIISSYLLFSKLKDLPVKEHKSAIKHYVVRMLKLYLFWFIVLLPVTIYLRKNWFSDGIWFGLLNLAIKPLLGSTFIASWYLTASIFGVLIINKLSKKNNAKILLPLFIGIYLICCYFSSYHNIWPSTIYSYVMGIFSPHLSVFAGLIFIYFGKIFAEKKIAISKRQNIILIIISSILLYIEWFTIYKLTGTYNNDCYVMIIPTAMLIFGLIKNIKIQIKNAKALRQFGNFIYPLHGSVAYLAGPLLHLWISNSILLGILNFSATLLVCSCSFFIVKKLGNKIKFLKYSY